MLNFNFQDGGSPIKAAQENGAAVMAVSWRFDWFEYISVHVVLITDLEG